MYKQLQPVGTDFCVPNKYTNLWSCNHCHMKTRATATAKELDLQTLWKEVRMWTWTWLWVGNVAIGPHSKSQYWHSCCLTLVLLYECCSGCGSGCWSWAIAVYMDLLMVYFDFQITFISMGAGEWEEWEMYFELTDKHCNQYNTSTSSEWGIHWHERGVHPWSGECEHHSHLTWSHPTMVSGIVY